MNAIFSRVSIRKYEDKPVEKEKIVLMLRAAMAAVRSAINLPEDLDAFALISCGYPAETRAQQDRYEESRVHYLE